MAAKPCLVLALLAAVTCMAQQAALKLQVSLRVFCVGSRRPQHSSARIDFGDPGDVSFFRKDGSTIRTDTGLECGGAFRASTGDSACTGTLGAHGSVSLGDASADRVTVNGVIQGTSSALVFEGGPAPGKTRFTFGDPAADNTITFPFSPASSLVVATVDGRISTGDINDGQVTGAKITAGTITGANLAPDIAITTSGLLLPDWPTDP